MKTIIFFAARQKDHARSSVSELLLALKDPRSLSESRNNTLKRKSQESGDVLSGDEVAGKRSSESGSRRNSRSGMRNSLQKISEVPEGGNKTRKSGLRSFMGYDNKPHDIIIAFALFQSFLVESLLSLHLFSHLIRLCSLIGMGHGNVEKNILKPREDTLLDSDDERPESFDDDFRRKEMRRGIDLATTLERIEKNFVITDPRLPDNPIVRQKLVYLLPLTSLFFSFYQHRYQPSIELHHYIFG